MAELLARDAIRLDERAGSRDEAISRCGEVLVEVGAVAPAYVDARLAREQSVSTYIGEGVAIPHGTLNSKESVQRDTLAVLRFPDGVDWDGFDVRVCVAIAAAGDGHVDILAQLATVLMDPAQAQRLRESTSVDDVITILEGNPS
ncbi:PTS sugar transporter subunit IIA [Micromonospora sp. M51]|uniref:PTS sugar transporter subunit IIA n=1 Tax=Micromonospora sp. M51 TaxID=2824889 RepID=UPI001B37F0B3|nr:PTS sugar transporter subunit IIA [Micromonospora sp. M51]MBQ1015583.1 PTS sugar transporter subunit IIA [Micromonospora sp. M51]